MTAGPPTTRSPEGPWRWDLRNARRSILTTSHDGVYRSFWDSEGSLHWGLYDQDPSPDGRDYLEACLRCNEVLAAALKPIGPDSHVLDLGSGNGNSALWLARRTGARVTGVDLSGVRVGHANALAKRMGADRVAFHKASATALPFAAGTFTHVWSQATLYHVHDRIGALRGDCPRAAGRGRVRVRRSRSAAAASQRPGPALRLRPAAVWTDIFP